MQTILSLQTERSLQRLIDARITRLLARRAAGHAQQRGHKMAIFANDLIGIDINQYGVYERDELELLFAFLQPLAADFATGVALDVGANIGNHALFFGPRFAQVHAFEPNPDTGELLRFNTRWRGNICVHAVGLGNEAGEFTLNEHGTNLGGSSIVKQDSGQDRQVSIEVKRLDDMALPLDGLCFMKLDVEGFEDRVIEGAMASIRRWQPLVVLEQHAAEFRAGEPPAIGLLRSQGYRFAWHRPPEQARHWLSRRWQDLMVAWRGQEQRIVTAEQVEPRHHSMLIAVPPRFQAALGLTGSPGA